MKGEVDCSPLAGSIRSDLLRTLAKANPHCEDHFSAGSTSDGVFRRRSIGSLPPPQLRLN